MSICAWPPLLFPPELSPYVDKLPKNNSSKFAFIRIQGSVSFLQYIPKHNTICMQEKRSDDSSSTSQHLPIGQCSIQSTHYFPYTISVISSLFQVSLHHPHKTNPNNTTCSPLLATQSQKPKLLTTIIYSLLHRHKNQAIIYMYIYISSLTQNRFNHLSTSSHIAMYTYEF